MLTRNHCRLLAQLTGSWERTEQLFWRYRLCLWLYRLFSTFWYVFAIPSFRKAPRILIFNQSPATISSTQTSPEQAQPHAILRLVANITNGFNFAIALHFSNLTQPTRVISFLLLPFDGSFDPSLAYLAIGALPLVTLLYHFGRGKEQPRLGGQWAVPKNTKVDFNLVLGAAIFGVGWGLGGICRELLASILGTCVLTSGLIAGPGLVNLGRALASGSGIQQSAVWVGSVALGGLLV